MRPVFWLGFPKPYTQTQNFFTFSLLLLKKFTIFILIMALSKKMLFCNAEFLVEALPFSFKYRHYNNP
jgi:hypothetical protein